MSVVRNAILQKKVLSLLGQVILLQSLAYGMQIAERKRLDVSVNSELLTACIAGNNLQVISLLAEAANVNGKDKDGWTALHFAVYKGHKEIAELLIKNGAIVNAEANDGFTALHITVRKGHKEIAELLIANGADINAKDNNGWTALHDAANIGHKEITELLIANRANVNARSKCGLLATLHDAAVRDHFDYAKEIVELLIASRAYVHAKNNDGFTALHISARKGHKEIIELLIKNGAKINTKDAKGLTALHYATAFGHKEIAKLLIAKAADVNAKSYVGQTALHAAAMNNSKEIAALLISKKADINPIDHLGGTALHYATAFRYKEIAELFMNALLASYLMRLLEKNKGMVLLTDLRLWLHNDYPNVGELQKLAEERKSLLCSSIQNEPLALSLQPPALLQQEIHLSNDEQEQAHFGEKQAREFNGLALDGEGLEAVISASMVKTLEEELKCSMYKLFDCIVGTSFGGIVALGLAASKEGDCPLLGTDDLIKFIEKYHNDILSEKLKIKNDGDALKQRLNALFKGSYLSDSLTRVMVPCQREHKAFDFDSREAQKRAESDCYIRDVARALTMEASTRFSDGVNRMTSSSQYKNKAAEFLFKKMDDNQTKKLHILYCASNAQDEGHDRIHNDLSEKLNASSVKYCRIIPENNTQGDSFDSTDLLALYKEKGQAAAEKFLAGNESFIHILQENRANKHKASL